MRPEAEEYVGKYVRVFHDFNSALPGELILSKGDVLKVTRCIDRNWLKGKHGTQEGSFPKDFVEKIHLPQVSGSQKLFAATENFPAQQNGDLGLQKGDIIIGIQPVDEFWWEGECNKVTGIFPITHVLEVEIPSLLRHRSQSVHSSEPLFAQALVDAVAQLDEELSFQAGDIIKVTEVIDEDWYMGECHNKSGMFLTSCVQLLNEEECIDSGTEERIDHASHNDIAPTISNNVNQTATLSHNQGPSQSLHRGSLPTQPGVVETGSSNYSDRNSGVTPPTRNSYSDKNAGVTPYARTLYQFVGENPDELSFESNDIVTLIQHVDEQWIEGEIDGKIGLFPANFVEIVVDCPYAYNTEQTPTDLQADLSKNNHIGIAADSVVKVEGESGLPVNEIQSNAEPSSEETFALVLHSFVSETAQDLSVLEGETLTVIRKIDGNWILARNESGREGMCPLSFVDMIGSMPECPPCDNNDNEIKTNSHSSPTYSPDISTKNSPPKHEINYNRNKAVQRTVSNKTEQTVKRLSRTDDMVDSPTQKPKLKPKPLLAPKPVLKPKPSLSPKPWTNAENVYKSVQFENSTLPKAASTKSFSPMDRDSEHTPTMSKSQSMSAINSSESKTDTDTSEFVESREGRIGTLTDTSELVKSRDSTMGSTSSLDSEKRNSAGKKAFEDWDLSKPLDSLIKNEFVRAKQDTESRSRSSSFRSSGSGVDATDLGHDTTPQVTNRRASYQGNYCRDNFESMDKDAYTVGNSVFFVSDSAPKDRRLRKPPLPPSFNRQPSVKRAAPPRPSAPQPSRTPAVPSRIVLPPGGGSGQAKGIPKRPQSTPRRQMRPAPPRPQGLSKRRSPPRPPTGNNLIQFSPQEPPQGPEDFEVEDDNESVHDLKNRIASLKKDLEGFKKSKEELELMRENVGENKTEVQENISFYEDNIQGVTAEINSLKETLAELSPRERNRMDQEKAAILQRLEEEKFREAQRKKKEEEREERREKRVKVIDELMQTERDFIMSLSLMMETFLSPDVEKHPDVDLKLLFGNIDEVADVSQRLLTKLEDATNNKDFSEQVIGTSFISLSEDMKDVYAPYCRNHDDVITLIEKYKMNAEINSYLDMLLDKLREHHTVFDLEALLIKPVQRVLKYPLLLNALSKATEEDHLDRKETLEAINCMTDVATAINEYKRRKDLVFKYKKKETEALGEKLSKLSLHSIKKKSSRIRGRFSANLGFSDMTRDPAFEKEETQYRHLEKTVKVFVKDVQLYLQEAQEVVNVMESIAADIEDYYGDKRDIAEVTKYQAFQNKVQMTFLPNFRMEADDLVLLPLSQLSLMFVGPNKVIQKRYDKLLDYDNMKRKAQNDRVGEKALQTAKQDYEALNAQLLDELPRLYALSFQLLQDCVGSFVRAQREYQNSILQETYANTDLHFLNDDNVMEAFNIQHTAVVDKLASLTFMPRAFSPRVADLKQDKKSKRMSLDPSLLRSADLAPQIDSQKVLILQQYPKEKLYRVTETVVAMDGVELSLCEGDVVGVVMEKDPMGNKERWFVDNGAKKGFVSCKVLTPYDSSPPRRGVSMPEHLLDPLSSTDGQSFTGEVPSMLESIEDEDTMDFALDEDMTPEVPVEDGELQLFYAEYAFAARNNNEVSLFEHQVVNVLAKHDQEGNTEWWYVEADGQYGYTPAIYLKEMDTYEDPT